MGLRRLHVPPDDPAARGLQRAAHLQRRLLARSSRRVLVTLVPQALAVTIPMALLVGLLIGFGRLSADRESVAFQACGISIYRLLRPVMLVAALAWAATSWMMFDAVPTRQPGVPRNRLRRHTQRVRRTRSSRASSSRTSPTASSTSATRRPGGGWRDVFLADTSNARRADRLHRRRRPAGHRPRKAHGRSRAARTARATRRT